MAKTDEPVRADEERVTVTQIHAVKLTDEEVIAKVDELGELLDEKEDLEQAWGDAKAEHKATLQRIETGIGAAHKILRRKAEDREVECHVVRDYAAGEVRTVRLDTGEVVSERTMTAEERQTEMEVAG